MYNEYVGRKGETEYREPGIDDDACCCLTTKAIESSSLTLKSIDDIKSSDCVCVKEEGERDK